MCIDRFPTDRMRHLDDEEWINGGLPSLPCPKVGINAVTSQRVLYVNHAMSTHVSDDAIFRMYHAHYYHFCDSNLQPPSITFCYCCAEEALCYVTMLDEEE